MKKLVALSSLLVTASALASVPALPVLVPLTVHAVPSFCTSQLPTQVGLTGPKNDVLVYYAGNTRISKVTCANVGVLLPGIAGKQVQNAIKAAKPVYLGFFPKSYAKGINGCPTNGRIGDGQAFAPANQGCTVVGSPAEGGTVAMVTGISNKPS